MKNLISIILLGLLLSSCGQDNSYKRGECKNTYGYDNKSEAYRNCIKDKDHFFAYGIPHWSKVKLKSSKEKEQLLKSINNIRLNINHDEYENISFSEYVEENFEGAFSRKLKEGKKVTNKKFWFLSEVTIHGPSEDDKRYSLWFGDPFKTGRFHNIDIQGKVTGKGTWLLSFDFTIPMHTVAHKVYGSFKPIPDDFMGGYSFYVEDIIFTETNNTIDFVIERMIFGYCKRNDRDVDTITKIYQNSLNFR